MEVPALGAVASLSLADVNYNDFGRMKEEEGSQLSCMGLFTLVLAGASAKFAIISMVVEASASTVAAGITALFVTPIVLVQRFQLNRMSTLRQVHNALRTDVNRMSLENDDLQQLTTSLAEKAQRVELVESNLSKVLSQQGTDLSSFVSLVKENGVLQHNIQDLIVAQVAQQLMASLIRADRNQDFQISDQEVTEVILRINSIEGMDYMDETRLRKVLSSGKQSLGGIYQTIKDLIAESRSPLSRAQEGAKNRDLKSGASGRHRSSVIQVSARCINAAESSDTQG